MLYRTAALSLALVPALSLAGPIDPPPGPVAPTHKTLTQIEPRTPINATTTPGDADSVYKITQPGSYYLTGDVVGVAGKNGIEVEAWHVTIDLNGFQVRGVPGSLAGIDPNGTAPNSPTSSPYGTLKNGVVTGWGANGFTGNNVGAWVFEEVKFVSNTGYGITVNSGSIFTRCYFYGNSLDGCATSNHVEFYYCFGSGNGGHGFAAGSDSQFVHCEAGTNAGSGFVVPLGGRAIACTATLNTIGIVLGDGGSADNCHVDMNRNEGIIVGKGGTVTRCAVDGNGTAVVSAGIRARLYTSVTNTTATISDCIVTNNSGVGILSAGGTMRDCMAELNGGGGFSMTAAGTIRGCTAKTNTGVGILGGVAVAILDCTAASNTTHGIQVGNDCRVRNNTCDSNGSAIADGAGIYILNASFPFINADNRVEENNCSDNDYGIRIEDTGNIAIRNTCSGNTVANFNIVAGNTKGAILSLAGADITTSNSWANIEY